jgi:hypothetical protein
MQMCADDWKEIAAKAQREAAEWRQNFDVLQRALVGDTGASRITVAAALRKDAERYRWLREQPDDTSAPRIDVVRWTLSDESTNEGEGLRMEALDAAVDEALRPNVEHKRAAEPSV